MSIRRVPLIRSRMSRSSNRYLYLSFPFSNIQFQISTSYTSVYTKTFVIVDHNCNKYMTHKNSVKFKSFRIRKMSDQRSELLNWAKGEEATKKRKSGENETKVGKTIKKREKFKSSAHPFMSSPSPLSSSVFFPS